MAAGRTRPNMGFSLQSGDKGCESRLPPDSIASSLWYLSTFSEKLTGLFSSFVARSQKTSGIGRLMVHVIEATELKACKPNGKRCFSSQAVVTPCFLLVPLLNVE